jgi:hypothetical protein
VVGAALGAAGAAGVAGAVACAKAAPVPIMSMAAVRRRSDFDI